jgi:hypothetical protein
MTAASLVATCTEVVDEMHTSFGIAERSNLKTLDSKLEERYAPKPNETPEQTRKREGAKRQFKYRNKPEKGDKDLAEISDVWLGRSQDFVKANPEKYRELNERHEDVGELVREFYAIKRAAEDEVHPSVCIEDIFQDAEQHGTANYREIEAMRDSEKNSTFRPETGEKPNLDSHVDLYRFYGFRIRLDRDVLRLAAEFLVRFVLQTEDHCVQPELFDAACQIVDRMGTDWTTSELLRAHRKSISTPETPVEAQRITEKTVDFLPLPEPANGWQVSRAINWPRSR